MKGRLDFVLAKVGSEEREKLVEAYLYDVGDSSFDDASTGGTAQQLIFGGDGTSQEDSGGMA